MSFIAVVQHYGSGWAEAVAIYQLQPDGKIGSPIWNAHTMYPTSICHAFAWQGDQLLFSKSDAPSNKRVENLSEDELNALKNAPGKTFRLDLTAKKAIEILPTAYKLLAVNAAGNQLAAGSPTGTVQKGAKLFFFDLETGKRLGAWNEPKWSPLGRDLSAFVDWSSNSNGVFVTGPRITPEDETDAFPIANLYFVTVQGELKAVGPKYSSLLGYGDGTLPLGVAGKDGTATSIYVNNNGYLAITRSSQEKTVRSYTWTEVQRIALPTVNDKDQSALQPVAIAPNGRMVLVQIPKLAKEYEQPTEAEFWLLDFENKRRRKLGVHPFVTQAYSWNGDRLIVALNKADSKERGPTFGFFQLPEAALPPDSPALQTLIERNGWETITPPLDENLVAVAKFLKTPQLAALPPAERWEQTPRPMFKTTGNAFAPKNSVAGRTWLIFDNAQKVLSFRAPLPEATQPEIPLPLAQARTAATEFLRYQSPELFAGEKQPSARILLPVTERGAYEVVFSQNEGNQTTELGRVEVRAGDGKIGGFETAKPAAPTPEKVVPAEEARTAVVALAAKERNPQETRTLLGYPRERLELNGSNVTGHPVWNFVAAFAAKDQTEPSSWVETLVDAATGLVISSRPLTLTTSQMKRWLALGGSGFPEKREEELLSSGDFDDGAPILSAKAESVAWLSNRPRTGIPAWWTKRPTALFVSSPVGGTPRLVLEGAEEVPQWSLDGKWLSTVLRGKVGAVNAATGQFFPIPGPPRASLTALAWLPDGRLAVLAQYNGPPSMELMFWTPGSAEPVLAVTRWYEKLRAASKVVTAAVSSDGKSLYLLSRTLNDTIGNCNRALYSLPIGQWDTHPTPIVDCLPNVDAMQVLPTGIFLAGRDAFIMVDPATKVASAWSPQPAAPQSATPQPYDWEGRPTLFPQGGGFMFAGRTLDADGDQVRRLHKGQQGKNPRPLFP